MTALSATVQAQIVPPRAPGPPRAQPRPGGDAGSSSTEPSGEIKAVTQAIIEEIDKRSELMANLEYLCDMIGPRLTGSPGLSKANEWTRDKFKQYGLTNPHLESWTIEKAWTRGEAKGHVVVPVEQRLLLESAGWGPSTKGPQCGPVVHLKAESTDELTPYKGRLKGAWVMALRGFACSPRPRSLRTNLEGEMRRRIRDFTRLREFRPMLRKFLVDEGAAGVLIDSNKEHGLVNMTTAKVRQQSLYLQAALPRGILDHRASCGLLIWRLLSRHGPGRGRNRYEEHVQHGSSRGSQHGGRNPRL